MTGLGLIIRIVLIEFQSQNSTLRKMILNTARIVANQSVLLRRRRMSLKEKILNEMMLKPAPKVVYEITREVNKIRNDLSYDEIFELVKEKYYKYSMIIYHWCEWNAKELNEADFFVMYQMTPQEFEKDIDTKTLKEHWLKFVKNNQEEKNG
jgi:hypothetical protein